MSVHSVFTHFSPIDWAFEGVFGEYRRQTYSPLSRTGIESYSQCELLQGPKLFLRTETLFYSYSIRCASWHQIYAA